MVRLRVAEFIFRGFNLNKFQFQYGAIKGCQFEINLCTRVQFQFQYGAIKGPKAVVMMFSGGEFQFQYGAIKGL